MIDKRLLSVSVVTILVLSIIVFSFPVSIATNQTLENFGFDNIEDQIIHGEGLWIDEESTNHAEILDGRLEDWDYDGRVTEKDSNGYYYSVISNWDGDIVRSDKVGEWEETGYEHDTRVMSLYLWNDMLFLGDREGGIYVSEDNGESFTKCFSMEVVDEEKGEYKYALHWSWDSDDKKLLVGEYGDHTNDAKVYRLNEYEDPTNENNWEVFFNARNHWNIQDDFAHIHDVTIDKYDDYIYINLGDGDIYEGLYIYDGLTGEFEHRDTYKTRFRDGHIPTSNGHLATVQPDEDRVYFFSDSCQRVIQYNKRDDELNTIGDYGKPVIEDAPSIPRFYDAVYDSEKGVIYAGSTQYEDEYQWERIWISLNGHRWYTLYRGDKEDFGTSPLNIIRNKVVFGSTSYIERLTREEVKDLIYPEDSNSFDGVLRQGSKIELPHRQDMTDVDISISGRRMNNMISNPTFDEPTDWQIEGSEITENDLSDTSYIGDNSLRIENHSGFIDYTGDLDIELGNTYHTGIAVKTSEPIPTDIDRNHIPLLETWYRDDDGNIHLSSRQRLSSLDGGWRYFEGSVYLEEKEGYTFDQLRLRVRDWIGGGNATMWIDGVFMSSNTGSSSPFDEFLEDETYSQDVKLDIDGDTYEIGDLEPGETETITVPELNSEFELLSGGVVDISYHDSDLELLDLDLPKEVVKGDTENIEVTVENRAETEQDVHLYIYGEKVLSENISGNEQIALDTEYTFDEPGDIEIEVRDEEDITIGSETVTVLDLFELSIDIEGEGEVSREPEEDEYIEGTEVELEAISDEGWNFSHWEGDYLEDQRNESEISLKMDQNLDITAVFEEITEYYDLVVDIDGSGEVEIDPEQDEYEEGTTVNLTALPEEGYEFIEWTGDYDGDEAKTTITIEEDMEITANFEEETISPWWYSLIFLVIGIVIIGIYLSKSRFRGEEETGLEEDEEVKTQSGLEDTEESKGLSEEETKEDRESEKEEKQIETKTLHCMNCNKYTDHQEYSSNENRWECQECGRTQRYS